MTGAARSSGNTALTKPAQDTPTTAAVARVEEQPRTLQKLMQDERAKAQILPFLRGAPYDIVVQEVLLAVSENPKLKDCTPSSLISSIARAVKWGGSIGEDVHLVPFAVNVGTQHQPQWEQRAKAIKDYKFKAKLIVASGAARQVYAVAVYANEAFKLLQGTQQSIEHEIILDEKKRGAPIGAYAVARLAKGDVQIVSKTLAEIDAIRQKHSKQWKLGPMPEWYLLKTVLHQLAKLLPQTPALQRLLAEDEQSDPDLGDSAGAGALASVMHHEPARITWPVISNGGYEVEPHAERDESGRPTPRESTVTSSPAESQGNVGEVEDILAGDRAIVEQEDLAFDAPPRRDRDALREG